MSLTGQFLFEENLGVPSMEERLEVFEKICSENNYYVSITTEYTRDRDEVRLIQGSFSDIPFLAKRDRVTTVYIVNLNSKDAVYWYEQPFYPTETKRYFRGFFFPDYSDQQDLILAMVRELMQRYPQAVFWTTLDWFYTKEDIDNIWQQPFDEEWPFKPPKNE